MRAHDFDIAIVGSGFAGALLAMTARKMGWRVLLLERGRHPRFAIGESSTPLSNLLLRDLARRFELSRLIPLTSWGRWQREYPSLPVGLKRGFSFYHHRLGERWVPHDERGNELLVGASPSDDVADTHWFREAFDAFMTSEAIREGAEFMDQVELELEVGAGTPVTRLRGRRGGKGGLLDVRCRLLVDASGVRGYLHRRLGGEDLGFQGYPSTWSVFGHFEGVRRWEASMGPRGEPYPPDDAAVHHVFEGGWMWVLRFNHGITSAGFSMQGMPPGDAAGAGGADRCWARLLAGLPSVREHFEGARAVGEIRLQPALPFRGSRVSGEDWLVLPGGVGFVDPLLSTGFALILLGIGRIVGSWEKRGLLPVDPGYAGGVGEDLRVTAGIIGALHRSMADFERFRTLCQLYFVAVSHAEREMRAGKRDSRGGFLLWDDAAFAGVWRRVLEGEGIGADGRPGSLRDMLAPWNSAGFLDPLRRHWYPSEAVARDGA